MKSINESIAVDTRRGVPRQLRWKGRTYRTRKLLDYWVLQTRWWGREERRVYFRLQTDRGVMEVYRTSLSGEAPRSEGPSTRSASSRPEGRGSTSRPQGGGNASRPESGGNASPPARPPLPVEGDTHTRERRRTDAVYRPDVRLQEKARVRNPKPTASERAAGWVLSKIAD